MNEAILVGNVGKDPVVRMMESGKKVANLTIATTDKWKDKSGQAHERTEWHNIVAWGGLAELCEKYVNKGRQLLVQGALQYRSYEKDGNKHYITEIKANKIQLLGAKNGGNKPNNDYTIEDVPF